MPPKNIARKTRITKRWSGGLDCFCRLEPSRGRRGRWLLRRMTGPRRLTTASTSRKRYATPTHYTMYLPDALAYSSVNVISTKDFTFYWYLYRVNAVIDQYSDAIRRHSLANTFFHFHLLRDRLALFRSTTPLPPPHLISSRNSTYRTERK